jgi:hypothetical protein
MVVANILFGGTDVFTLVALMDGALIDFVAREPKLAVTVLVGDEPTVTVFIVVAFSVDEICTDPFALSAVAQSNGTVASGESMSAAEIRVATTDCELNDVLPEVRLPPGIIAMPAIEITAPVFGAPPMYEVTSAAPSAIWLLASALGRTLPFPINTLLLPRMDVIITHNFLYCPYILNVI